MTIRLPPVKAFVLYHLPATPVARGIAALSEAKHAALARQVGLALQPYADGEGVAVTLYGSAVQSEVGGGSTPATET